MWKVLKTDSSTGRALAFEARCWGFDPLSVFVREHGLLVKTLAFQASEAGSIPAVPAVIMV